MDFEKLEKIEVGQIRSNLEWEQTYHETLDSTWRSWRSSLFGQGRAAFSEDKLGEEDSEIGDVTTLRLWKFRDFGAWRARWQRACVRPSSREIPYQEVTLGDVAQLRHGPRGPALHQNDGVRVEAKSVEDPPLVQVREGWGHLPNAVQSRGFFQISDSLN